jgi:integrase
MIAPDRPLLRLLVQPEQLPPERVTVRYAYEEYLVPEIADAAASTRADYSRFVTYWEEFEREQNLTAQFTQSTQGQPELDPRTSSPWVLSDISSRLMSAFIQWMFAKQLSDSTVDKAQKTIKRVIELAGREGVKVNSIKTKPIRPKPAAKHYLDDLQIACLWSAANGAVWPIQFDHRRRPGSGMPPSTFWRAILIMLRTYGMRVQDLVAYESIKEPILWRDITWTERTPNPEGKCDWQYGWLHYVASKTGHQYYLPLTRHARAALDRLYKHAQAICGESVPPDRPILPCPTGHGLTNAWKLLQATARVAKPTGEHYQLEDFRKTCATYLDEHCPELAYHVCGWSHAGSKIAHRHYINSERKLVASLPSAPMPGCFDEWLEAS